MNDLSGYLHWRPDFLSVVDQRLYPAEWLDQKVVSGSARFWRTDRAAILAELRTYPSGACEVHGLVAAGDVGDIRNVLIPIAEEWGRSCGALGAVIESRPAWAKLLKDQGYDLHQVSVRKDFA